MARELEWTDTEEIGIQLQEMFPDTDPYSVRFTDLHKWVVQLPGFVGDPGKSNEVSIAFKSIVSLYLKLQHALRF